MLLGNACVRTRTVNEEAKRREVKEFVLTATVHAVTVRLAPPPPSSPQ